MSYLATVLSVVLFLVTIGVLLAGLYSMGRGGEFDDRNSTRLMFSRVGVQGLAVAMAVVLLFIANR